METVNGRLQNQFRQLRSQNFNLAATHLFDESRIAGPLLNAFGTPLTDHRLVDEVITHIEPRFSSRNRLCEYILVNNFNRKRAHFQPIDAAVLGGNDFPILSADDLIIYAMDTYQIHQVLSYYGEHVKNGSYIIEV